jgi:hypothetical protein
VSDAQVTVTATTVGAQPSPRRVLLPLGGEASMYTREHLTLLYHCSHGELGRLLARNMAPLPIRVDGVILWYTDEALRSMAQVMRTLERWRRH